MADNVSLTISVDGIGDYLKKMISRAGQVRGWLNRVAYPKIIKAQQMRWITEGASEGDGWAPINPTYARYKLRKYADYPGAGRKLLIATGRLYQGMTGENRADHYKLATETTLEVGTTVSYAKYVNETRNIVELSPETVESLVSGLSEYIMTGKE